MKTIHTAEYLTEEQLGTLSPDLAYWFYSGMDSAMTEEIRHKLLAQLDDVTRPMYEHTIRMQAPIMDMMLRGFRIDPARRADSIAKTEAEERALCAAFTRLCVEGLGLNEMINPGSHTQVKWLFYEYLQLPVVKKKNSAGVFAPASDRETLEGLRQHFVAEPIVNFILAIRDKRKTLSFLRTPTDPDGKMRYSLNLSGTTTGRLSSSYSAFGTGTNGQNWDKNLKDIFIADPGMILVNVDLEQADSRNVGALCWNLCYDMSREEITRYLRLANRLGPKEFWDGPVGPEFAGSYLDACESGDLHTYVCSMAWPELPWTGDKAVDRAIADEVVYRTYSRRDMSKKLGHGSNYLGQPPTMAMHARLPTKPVAIFQDKYFDTFPCIPVWHAHTIETLQSTRTLTHLFGRRRIFWDDVKQQSVINAAVAYCPQGMTGEAINRGILNLFFDRTFQLMLQVHDSVVFQIPYEQVNDLVPLALQLLEAHLTLKGGRDYFIPLEAQTGYNYGYASESNPAGLKKYKGNESRLPPRSYARKPVLLSDLIKKK